MYAISQAAVAAKYFNWRPNANAKAWHSARPLKGRNRRASGGAADAIPGLTRLGLKNLGGFIGDAHRQRRNALVRVDRQGHVVP